MLTVPCVAVLQKVDISPCSYNPLMNCQTLPESGRGRRWGGLHTDVGITSGRVSLWLAGGAGGGVVPTTGLTGPTGGRGTPRTWD